MHDTNKIIYEFFSDDDFLRISEAIKEAEKITSGEIKVSLKEKRKFSERKKSLKELAAADFARLRMSETRDKTGVLIFLLLSEKMFYILADEGINEKVEQKVWDEVRDKIQEKFTRGHFTDGIILGIREIANILAPYFPIKADDTNEISNAVDFDK
jgi:uncharacterized membrane protein